MKMKLRSPLALLIVSTGLSGCLYYGDIHGKSQKLTASSLATPHIYKPNKHFPAQGWWARFKDPQLNQFIDIALRDAPDMQLAEARVRRAIYSSKGAGAAQWPMLDFSGYLQHYQISTEVRNPNPFPNQNFNIAPNVFQNQTFNWGLTLADLALNFNYEFDFWGKNRQRLLASLSEQEAVQADMAEAQLVISTAVANTYFQLLSTIAQEKIAKAQWHLSQQRLDIISRREKQGMNSSIPALTLKTSVQAAQLSYQQYQQAEQLFRHQLAELLGKNPFSTQLTLKPFAFHGYQIQTPKILAAKILAQRPDIHAAMCRAEAAASLVKVSKARFFPDINFNFLPSLLDIQFNSPLDFFNLFSRVTGSFDLPIFDAGARRADLGAKYAEYDLAVNSYNKSILTALREIADQHSNLSILGSQLKTQNISLRASRRGDELSKSLYKNGIVDNLQVISSRQLLLQQESTTIAVQTLHLQATVAMIKALGGRDFNSKG